MAVGIRDIAKQLNLSVSTVSYALNGGPRPVTPEIRDLVLATARDLDYRPHRIAKMLSTGRSKSIGFVPTWPGPGHFTSPYLHSALNGVLEACKKTGHDALVAASPTEEDQTRFVDQLLDGRADAFVFLNDARTRAARELVSSKGIPLAIIGGGDDEPGFVVRCNNRAGMEAAVQHLFDLGHCEIAFLAGPEDNQDAKEREDAFHQKGTELGLTFRDRHLGRANYQVHLGKSEAQRILAEPNPPTAIVCCNDESALGAMQAAYAAGLRIPEDLSIVGFDDFSHAWAISPALTTVAQHTSDMGFAATIALVRFLEGESPERSTIFPSHLIVRESTSAPKKERYT